MDLSCERQAMLVLHLTHLLCIQLQVNQIGTVTESVQAALDSKAAGWGVMVSHRSGETEDNFIADLSVGLASGQVCFFFFNLWTIQLCHLSCLYVISMKLTTACSVM
jgi:hypothetical protein